MQIDTSIVSPDNSLLDVSVEVGAEYNAYDLCRSTSFQNVRKTDRKPKLLSPVTMRKSDYESSSFKK